MDLGEAKRFLMRHRFEIWDGIVWIATAFFLIVLAAEYEILHTIGVNTTAVEGIELGEVLLIAVVLGGFLVVTIRRARAQAREVRRRTAAEKRAHELAFQDPLTGLPNRRQFEEIVATAVASPTARMLC